MRCFRDARCTMREGGEAATTCRSESGETCRLNGCSTPELDGGATRTIRPYQPLVRRSPNGGNGQLWRTSIPRSIPKEVCFSWKDSMRSDAPLESGNQERLRGNGGRIQNFWTSFPKSLLLSAARASLENRGRGGLWQSITCRAEPLPDRHQLASIPLLRNIHYADRKFVEFRPCEGDGMHPGALEIGRM